MFKVVIYSIDYSEGLHRRLPYVRYYAERGLCHLSALRERGTRVVLVTPTPVDDKILDYHLRRVLGMGEAEIRAVHDRLLLYVPQSSGGSLADRVLRDDSLIAALSAQIAKADESRLVNFSPSASGDLLSAQLGIPLEEGPAELAELWGSKAGGKYLIRQAGVPTARGDVDVLYSAEEIAHAIRELARADPPAHRVIVKLNDASWGDAIGNAVVSCGALESTGSLRSAVEVVLQDWEDFLGEIAKGGSIVEEYLTDVVCSPSGQGFITETGDVVVSSSHEQIVVSGQYLGCAFPGPPAFLAKVRDAVERIGRKLGEEGVRGTFGVDFIAFETGGLLATEINLRKVGPSHVLATVEAALGVRVSPDGHLYVDGERIYYEHHRFYRPDVLVGLTPEEAITVLGQENLLFDRGTRRGTMLHILGALATCGYVETTTLAGDPAEASALAEMVHATLVDRAGDAVVGREE